MFRSPIFTVIGVLALLLLCAAVTFQALELDSYGMLDALFKK